MLNPSLSVVLCVGMYACMFMYILICLAYMEHAVAVQPTVHELKTEYYHHYLDAYKNAFFPL